MTEPIQIFSFLLAIFGAVYCIIILAYTIGWFSLKTYRPVSSKQPNTIVTIIVPARNEEKNIGILLKSLIQQDYPKDNFEIIIINDNSTDNTASVVTGLIKQYSENDLKILHLSEENPQMAFKKKAIAKAIEASRGELIITTDADCRVGKKWLTTFASFYQSKKIKMIVGPVCFRNESSFFEKIQSSEFLSLIAITGGAIRIKRPIMCNGANLAYEKKAFYAAGGFGEDKFSSGDDVFLLFKIKRKFGNNAVQFLKNMDAMVYTEPKKNIREFFQQRIRWASKNKGYHFNVLWISFTVYMVNLLLISGLISAIFIPSMIKIVVISFLIKIAIDLPVLLGITNFVKRQKILFNIFPMIIAYPVYIVITGALGIIGKYHWKGRKIKN